MEVSREAARILKKKYGAERVVLFGSLARSSLFVPTSDIDLYTEGIPGDLFFEAEAEIEEIAKGFKVDLVETKECPPQLLREIEDEGIDL
jgi:predicted nucleotidyltransferase